jgi:methionyl-tRNA synthetase
VVGTGKPWTLLNKLSTTEFLNYEQGKFSKSNNRGVFGDHALESGIPSEVRQGV